jgi:hypothetical protein
MRPAFSRPPGQCLPLMDMDQAREAPMIEGVQFSRLRPAPRQRPDQREDVPGGHAAALSGARRGGFIAASSSYEAKPSPTKQAQCSAGMLFRCAQDRTV